MAQHCVQGRGVLLNMKKHYGEERHPVSYDDVMRMLEADGIEIEKGDIVCCYTGYADKLIELGSGVPPDLPRTHCPAFRRLRSKLLQWIDDSGMSVLVSDNRAVEYEHGGLPEGMGRGPRKFTNIASSNLEFTSARCGTSLRSPSGLLPRQSLSVFPHRPAALPAGCGRIAGQPCGDGMSGQLISEVLEKDATRDRAYLRGNSPPVGCPKCDDDCSARGVCAGCP